MSRFLAPHFFVGTLCKNFSYPLIFVGPFENGFLLVVCRGYSSIEGGGGGGGGGEGGIGNYIFNIAILIGIPSGSLCGGERDRNKNGTPLFKQTDAKNTKTKTSLLRSRNPERWNPLRIRSVVLSHI